MDNCPRTISEKGGCLAQRVRRMINVRPAETSALAWSWLYVFALFLACVLSGMNWE